MRRFLPVVAVLLLGFAPAPFPKPSRAKPRPQIEGLWHGKYDLLVTASRMTYNPGSSKPCAYDLRLDESARPRAYSIHLLPNSTFEGNGAHGVYKVEGDTLTISYSPASELRPTAFSGPGSGAHTEVYQRVRR